MGGLGAPGTVETKDNDGSTVAYSGTATTTVSNIPAIAGNVISGCEIVNRGSINLEISFDGGATYATLEKKESLSWDIKGNITQIKVKTLVDTTVYGCIINFEDF